MSFDPFGQDPSATPQSSPGQQPTFPGPAPAPGQTPNLISGREQVQLPGIFLIATGLLNLLCALLLGVAGFAFSRFPADKFEQEMAKQQPENLARLREAGWTIDDMLRVYVYSGVGGGTAVFVAALISILGGICMMAQRRYGLAMFGALVTAVPCISPLSCPCLFGMMIGLWSVTVLLNQDVRAGFR